MSDEGMPSFRAAKVSPIIEHRLADMIFWVTTALTLIRVASETSVVQDSSLQYNLAAH